VHLVDVCAGAHANVANDNLDHRFANRRRGYLTTRRFRGNLPSV
jgi:hypothetical protein